MGQQRIMFMTVLMAYITLMATGGVLCRSHGHGLKHHYNHHRSQPHSSYHNSHNHHSNSQQQEDNNNQGLDSRAPTKHLKGLSSGRLSDEDYEYDDEDGGRHAYLMTKDTKKASTEKAVTTEDQTLTQAFEQHMKPGSANAHDVYAYQLPSDLWFVVRYSKKADGQIEKYMNVVDSFTNYLEKLDKDVRTVSVNVKGVETVFRLTPKRKSPEN